MKPGMKGGRLLVVNRYAGTPFSKLVSVAAAETAGVVAAVAGFATASGAVAVVVAGAADASAHAADIESARMDFLKIMER